MTPGTKTRTLWLPSADTFWTFTSGPRPTTRNPPPATFATASWPDSVSFRSALVWPSLLTLLVARVANRPVVHSSQSLTHSLTHTPSSSLTVSVSHHCSQPLITHPLTQLAQRSAHSGCRECRYTACSDHVAVAVASLCSRDRERGILRTCACELASSPQRG